jgi:DNA-binding response OmpR family regulator
MALHVLIIDPDASAAQVTCATIRHLAPQAVCTVANDPVQGWLRLRQQPAEMLIIDPARYPQVGQRLLEQINDTLPQIRVIVLSSAATPAAGRMPGVSAYLDKALSPRMLRIKLRALLQSVATANGAATAIADARELRVPDPASNPLDQAA